MLFQLKVLITGQQLFHKVSQPNLINVQTQHILWHWKTVDSGVAIPSGVVAGIGLSRTDLILTTETGIHNVKDIGGRRNTLCVVLQVMQFSHIVHIDGVAFGVCVHV
jgi:hypothetical protein